MDVTRWNAIMKQLVTHTKERAIAYKTFTGAFIVKDRVVIWRDITSIEDEFLVEQGI